MSRVILLTSTFLRHQFVANTVSSRLDLVGLWQEEKGFQPESYAGNANDLEVIQRHFRSRDESEEEYFGPDRSLRLRDGAVHRKIPAGTINAPEEVAMMKELKADLLLVFGSGLLKEGIIDLFPGNIINIHLGLSPYYRGSGTNFWPLVNREPEYVGATIHELDIGIDTGPIIAHVRPDMEADDGPHDLGNKTIVLAAEMQCRAAAAHLQGPLTTVVQKGGGKLYRQKDFNAGAVRTLYKNFEEGMIAEYLAEKPKRDSALDLVSLTPSR